MSIIWVDDLKRNKPIEWQPGYFYNCFITRSGSDYFLTEGCVILFDSKFIATDGKDFQFVVLAVPSLLKGYHDDENFIKSLDQNLDKYEKLALDIDIISPINFIYLFSERAKEMYYVDRQRYFCYFCETWPRNRI